MKVLVLVALVVLSLSLSVSAQEIRTKIINVPDSAKGTAAKIEVHMVTDSTRAPNAPPKPSAPAVACGRPCASNANNCCDSGSAPGNVNPATQVVTPAAPLQGTTQPLTNDAGQNNAPNVMPLQTSSAVKVVANLDQQCGCPPNAADPCDNPCAKPTRGLNDELEQRLIDVKNDIVSQSQKLKNDRIWVKQVLDIIKHYDAKIKAVNNDENVLKENIKKLFDKKEKYEKLLVQYRIDKDHFTKLVGGEKAPAIPTINPPSTTTTTTKSTLEFNKEIIV